MCCLKRQNPLEKADEGDLTIFSAIFVIFPDTSSFSLTFSGFNSIF